MAKLDDTERLTNELQKYNKWIKNWESSATNPTLHTHLGSAAITYRLQSAADNVATPAPTLDEQLEQIRLSEWTQPIETTSLIASDVFQAVTRAVDRLVALNSQKSNSSESDEFWLDWSIRELALRGIDHTILNRDWQPIKLSKLIDEAVACLRPNFSSGVVHGDIHGRNVLILDRLPAFIDFSLSGPGHPLVDLIRLDSVIRSATMRMLIDKRSLIDVFQAIYVNGDSADSVLNDNPALEVCPLTKLAIRTAAKVRQAAMTVGVAHGLGLKHYLAMTCVVSAHILVNRSPGSGIERLILSVVGSQLFSEDVV